MQKQIKVLLTLLITLFLAVSCSKDNVTNPIKTKEEILQQKWEYANYAGSGYNITADKVDSFYTDSTDNQEKIGYSVAIKEIVWNADNTSGMIYGQYTSHSDTTLVNKYYAIAFKDLTETTIDICGASKQIGTDPSTGWGIFDSSAESLEEAKTKFTEANGYIIFDEGTKCKVVK
ncbi:hypothetical protein [Brachyspira hampsonii]|uniref:hypothetical protein n=1 Tax=Brachyspira hampsonii TaxID=1287055 RepID=UPI000D3ABCCC|nr:hypothetical protein [Brachyspira hampsonii]PTY40428.1 hypothetical protein DQ06_07575 [Brachyspira hampsonii bv. II]